MIKIFNTILPFVEGMVLGVIFFFGLWWTVKKGVLVKQPAFLFLVSFFLRIGIVLAGFYFAAGGHWENLLVSLLGFVVARYIITKLVGPPVESQMLATKEAKDAP